VDGYSGGTAILTTKHGKERAIGPALTAAVGLRVLPVSADTDALGTFTGEVERPGDIQSHNSCTTVHISA
jgi:hypothetical protein